MTVQPSSTATAERYAKLLERLDAGANHRDYPEAFGGSWTQLCLEAAGAIRSLSRAPAQGSPDRGEVPTREAFWLVERMGTGLYVKTGPGDLTDNVWHAHRFDNERAAFDYARLSQAPWAKDLRATEHVFVNKADAAPQPTTAAYQIGNCGEWRDIETAPQDGNGVIVWDNLVLGEAYFDISEKSWWWANTGPGDYTAEAIYPTLWRPMPASPLLSSTDREGK